MDLRKITGEFLEYIIYNLIFPLENQECIGEGKGFWCIDWWVTEVCKCFFEGEIDYLRFPIARRLEGNKNFDKKVIVEAALSKANMVDEMILTSTDRILVIETCRGLDTLLATTVRNWSKIYVGILSKYPEVIKKTETYLERFPNVEVIIEGAVTEGNPFRMRTNGFQGV